MNLAHISAEMLIHALKNQQISLFGHIFDIQEFAGTKRCKQGFPDLRRKLNFAKAKKTNHTCRRDIYNYTIYYYLNSF